MTLAVISGIDKRSVTARFYEETAAQVLAGFMKQLDMCPVKDGRKVFKFKRHMKLYNSSGITVYFSEGDYLKVEDDK